MKLAVISQRVDEIKDYGEVRDALDEEWQQLFLQMNTALSPDRKSTRLNSSHR